MTQSKLEDFVDDINKIVAKHKPRGIVLLVTTDTENNTNDFDRGVLVLGKIDEVATVFTEAMILDPKFQEFIEVMKSVVPLDEGTN